MRAATTTRRWRHALTGAEWARLALMAACVALLHVAGLGLLLVAADHHYRLSGSAAFGVGTGVLAYTLGTRHAFDADHISAIDNATRKLMAEKRRPLSVGFFFSLGHSTVVLALTVLLGLGIRGIGTQVRSPSSGLHHLFTIIGTSVSGAFLYVIAALNLAVLVSILRVAKALRAGTIDEPALEAQLDQRGLMNRFFGPIARRVDSAGKMYPVGVLFGLGFDTATEVGLLVVSGTAVAGGLPFYALLSLPLLFAAGMSLFDTADGCFMNFAYGWAFSRPARKLFYNVTVTGLSVSVAFAVGTIELLGLLTSELGLSGWPWRLFSHFDINLAGFVIVGLFVVTWAVAIAVWRFGGLEARWDAGAASR